MKCCELMNFCDFANANEAVLLCDGVVTAPQLLDDLPDGRIEFELRIDRNSEWCAQSTNLSGILTGGWKDDDIDKMIEDAISTYFDVPAKYKTVNVELGSTEV